MKKQNEKIYNYFNTIRRTHNRIDDLFVLLDEKTHYAVIGGAIRAAIDSEDITTIRDIDIILQADNKIIYEFLKGNNIRFTLNSFSGLKFNLDEIQFDVWNIENHFAFKNGFLSAKFKNISRTTLLNYDSVIYDFTSKRLYDSKYQSCKKKKTIDLISSDELCKNNPSKAVTLCKIFEIKKTEKFNISYKVKNYIKEYYDIFPCKTKCLEGLKIAYKKHYKVDMDKKLWIYIKNELKKICSKN